MLISLSKEFSEQQTKILGISFTCTFVSLVEPLFRILFVALIEGNYVFIIWLSWKYSLSGGDPIKEI